jgi:hypothetical protein
LTLNSTGVTTLNGAIGSNFALTSLTTNAGGSTVINGGVINTTGVAGQVFNDAVQLQSDTTLNASAGAIDFASTIDSYNATTHALTLNSTGVTTLNGAIGSNFALTSLTTNAGGSTVINGGVINTTGVAGQVFNDAVSLQSDTTLNAGSGAINFVNTIDSLIGTGNTTHSLTLNSTGVTTLNDVIGGNFALTSLTTNAGGSTIINAGTINTTGAVGQVFNDAVSLQSDTTLNAGSGAIDFANTIDSLIGTGNTTHSLTLNSTGVTTLNGAIGSNFALTSLTTNAGGSTVINGGSITTTGAAGQVFNDAVSLQSDTTLNAGSGAINFVNTIDSLIGTGNTTHSLSLNSTGLITLNGAIGSNFALTSLTTNAGGSTLINGGSITTSGSAGQVFNDTVSLQSDTTLNAGMGGITFMTTVDSANSTTPSALILNSSTGSTFNGTVGATYALKSLNVNTTAIALNGSSVNTVNNQDYNGAVTLGVNNSLTSTAGSITLDSTVNNNGYDLTISAAELSAISGVMSGTGSLILNNTDNAILALDSMNTYTGDTEVGGGILQLDTNQAISAVSVTTINNSDVSATLDLNGYNESLQNISGNGYITLGSSSATNFTINNTAALGFSGSISGMGNLIKSGSGTYTLSGTNSYVGTTNVEGGILSVTSNTGLGDNSSNVTVQSGAQLNISNNITFGNNLILYGSGTDGNGALQATGTDFVVGNVNVNMSNNTDTQISAIGANDHLTIEGVVTGTNLNINNYSGAVGTVELANSGNSNPTASSNPSYTGNTNVFSGTLLLDSTTAVNNTTNLNLLNNSVLSYQGVTNVTIAGLNGSGTFDINNLNVITGDSSDSLFTGTLVGNGTLTKVGTGTMTLTGTNAFTGSTFIDFGTLDLASNATLGNVQVNSGATLELSNSAATAQAVVLNGNGMNNLGALLSNGTSSLTSPIYINANTLINTTSGTLTLTGNIDASLASTQSALTFEGAGAVVINGALGSLNPLSSLTTSASASSTTTINGTGVATIGDQDYNDPLFLSAPASQTTPVVNTYTLNSSNGAITANSTIDGGVDLIVDSSGATTFNGAVGSNTALSSITTNAASTGINGGIVNTVNSQTYNNAVTFNTDATLTMLSDGNLTMNNGIDGTATVNGTSILNNLTLIGAGTNMNNFVLGGGIALNNLTLTTGLGNDNITISGNVNMNNVAINSNYVNGSSNSNNTLTLLTTSPIQNWTITSANGGNIVGVANNQFTFNNIQNIVGGNYTNNFVLSGGTLSGTVTGGTGVNTLTADNVANTWNITGYNLGTVTGILGFSNIQNLVGGNSSNMFNFYGDSEITGLINGVNTNVTNTLNFASYANAVNAYITGTNTGYVLYNGTNVSNYENITNVNSNGSGELTIDTAGTNVIHITGAGQGYVNDPITFAGFNTINNANSAVATQVIFDAHANYNATLNTALVGSTTFDFINIPNIDGSLTSQVTSSENSAIVSSVSSTASSAASSAAASSQSDASSSLSISDQSSGGGSSSGGGGSGGGSSQVSANSSKVSTNCS